MAAMGRIAEILLVLGLMACERPVKPDSEEPKTDSATEAALVRTAGDSTLTWSTCPEPLPAGCELTVLHGDPAKPNADILMRVPAGYAIPPHTHSSAERMILLSGRLAVHFQGSPPAQLLPGTYAYGPAGRPHSAACVAAEPCVLFIAFEGPIDVKAYRGAIT